METPTFANVNNFEKLKKARKQEKTGLFLGRRPESDITMHTFKALKRTNYNSKVGKASSNWICSVS